MSMFLTVVALVIVAMFCVVAALGLSGRLIIRRIRVSPEEDLGPWFKVTVKTGAEAKREMQKLEQERKD